MAMPRLPRPLEPTTLRTGSIIYWDQIQNAETADGRIRLHAPVLCGKCQHVRLVPLNNLDRTNGLPNFTGYCHPCHKNLSWAERGRKGATFRYLTKRGYVKIRMTEHPAADMHGDVFEHRLVMERMIGRYLASYEHVHHKNKVKHDNRPENLELVSAREHAVITSLERRVQQLEALLRSRGVELPPWPSGSRLGHQTRPAAAG